MLKKIQVEHDNYISGSKKRKDKHTKHIHASNNNKKTMKEEKKKEIENLLHEHALLMKEYFRIQRSLFTSLQPKILYLQKRSS